MVSTVHSVTKLKRCEGFLYTQLRSKGDSTISRRPRKISPIPAGHIHRVKSESNPELLKTVADGLFAPLGHPMPLLRDFQHYVPVSIGLFVVAYQLASIAL